MNILFGTYLCKFLQKILLYVAYTRVMKCTSGTIIYDAGSVHLGACTLDDEKIKKK
jgi:hypothetical protein